MERTSTSVSIYLVALILLFGVISSVLHERHRGKNDQPLQYKVKKDDTLSGIANRFLGSGGEWQQIADLNNLDSPDRIPVGEVLLVPRRSIKGYYQIGVASWYGPGFHGRVTTSGERYNMHSYTAAHKYLPLGTRVRIVNLENGKSVQVKINDRGPFVGERVIDLSYGTAKALDVYYKGLENVKIEVISFPETV